MQYLKTLSIVCLSASLSLAACKKPDGGSPAAAGDPPAATKPGDHGGDGVTIASDDDYVKQASAMLETMTGTIKSAGTDCDKLADGITKMISDNGSKMTTLDAYEKAHPDAKKKFEDVAKDKTKAFEAAAGPGMSACQNNKKVSDAFAKIPS